MIDWMRLQQVYETARAASVGFTLTYEESCDEWYFTVNSPAPTEQWVGKSRSFDVAVDSVCDWLRAIMGRP
jgi:hypothetical protein